MSVKEYKSDLLQRYWAFRKSHFANDQSFFDSQYIEPTSPPVFKRNEAWRNVIVNPDASEKEKRELLGLIPNGEWHKWYGSMNSSQALAQSVLGNLSVYGFLDCLSEIKDDDGLDLFGKAKISSDNFEMEHKVNHLNEPRPTSLDGYISGEYQVAIECKFTEPEVGTCSRPRLRQTDSNYEREHCDGSYSVQRPRKEYCSLTEIGVLYWEYVPKLFNWQRDRDYKPLCPLNKNYQLVRNILAIGVKNEIAFPDNGYVVLIYDERNPAFQENGDGLNAYIETKLALIMPTMLRKCSWQKIVSHLRAQNMLPWLMENLNLKYGF